MLDRCCAIWYNNHSLKMKGVLEMKVVDLIKRLQMYPSEAVVSIEDDVLRVVDYAGCNGSAYCISLKDTVSETLPFSKEKILDAVTLLQKTCENVDCSECVLSTDSGDCILLLNSPDRWGLKTVEQNCKER